MLLMLPFRVCHVHMQYMLMASDGAVVSPCTYHVCTPPRLVIHWARTQHLERAHHCVLCGSQVIRVSKVELCWASLA